MRTIQEINEKIKLGKAVVYTAKEVKELIENKSIDVAYNEVDVVTTGTFGPMCSSGAFINFGHSSPPVRMEKTYLNDVECYSGIAAVDTYIGATQEINNNEKIYGGANVIYDLICGKTVELKAYGKGTDCYPKKDIKTKISLTDLNEAYLFNPRNVYQNYNAATNTSNKRLFTYMGTLLEDCKNINYCTSGELSPLLNDPVYETIGVGTNVFLAGAQGIIAHEGTQFNSDIERDDNEIPIYPAATLALIADMKDMNKEYIKPAYFKGYGISLFIGVGIPIPILNKNVLKRLSIRDENIYTNILDYADDNKKIIKRVSYKELKSGHVFINGKQTKSFPISDINKAEKICVVLKNEIINKNFYLNEPIRKFKNKKIKKMKVDE